MNPEQQAQFLALGREVLAQQASSQLLGAELVALSPGHCTLALAVRPELLQQNGFVHGGVLSYLADNALTYAGGTALKVPVVTAEFKVNCLRPAVGTRLVAVAEAVHVGRSQAVGRCEVRVMSGDVGDRLCALAQGTVVPLGEAPPGSSAHPAGTPAA